MSTFTFDIEGNNLLNQQTIDYNASPYCLTDAFKMHCVVVEEHGSGKLIAFYDGPTYVFDGRRYEETDGKHKYILEDYAPEEYEHRPLSDFPSWVKSGAVSKIVGQNIINFDLLATKLYFGLDYTVEEDSWAELPVKIEDTMILSKVLNPDRLGGHSLDNLSSKTGVKKIAFRKNIHQDERFKFFAADMLYYCFYDCKSNTKVYEMLMKEWGDWKWDDAYRLEKAVADIITRQEHRGFKFDMDLAQKNIEFLDKALEERRQRVEPILPPKMATKTYLKGFIPPANQFVQSGKPHANIVKFCAKHGGEVEERDDSYYTTLYGKEYKLPLPVEPVCDLYVPSTLNDTTHIKDWLVGLGWLPSEYKEKDLSVKTGKIKRTQQEIWKAIDGYVEQTLSTNFKNDRCDHLGVEPYKLKEKLLKFKEGRAIKVLTNPSFTKGQEKEICPNLIALVDKFPYAKDIVEYLTYKHRRNSILGGGALWDEDEDDFEKGYVASVRPDGRIPTPAATCDAATSRMKHRLVANIPRVTSLFGHEMRAMFGVDRDKFFQMGYDFDSLEAKEESSYCWKYDSDKEYCNSLIQEKPNDVHTLLSKRISQVIEKQFARSPAKSVKYGITYGSQAPKVAKTVGCDLKTAEMIYNAFWQAALPLKLLKDKLTAYWESTGKKFVLGLDGRKVPTRSAHAILNSLLQSAGVICAKRAMVIHDKLLKENNLSVDFFKDDWKNKAFCQQLIAYHDEAQAEISKELVKFKMFKTQEECACFKADQASLDFIWSDVKESPKGGWYVAYTLAGDLASRAVKASGEYYKMNVELTAGYMLGYNWGDCH